MNKDKDWRQFEIAVANLLKALDPTAKITHDKEIPDKDTGRSRQRDVWIETTVCKHFSLKMLVSCKRYKRKVDQQHMDAFIGEQLSSGAQKGVIYSFSGFTKPALEKASAKGISCCKLYQKEPPDIPGIMLFNAFLLTPAFHFSVYRVNKSIKVPETIAELLDVVLPSEDVAATLTILDFMESKYLEQRAMKRSEAKKLGTLPKKWMDSFAINDPVTGTELFELNFGGDWDIYEARLEGCVVNGSYNFNEIDFKGNQIFPQISPKGPNPGAGWKKRVEIPADVNGPTLFGILYGHTKEFRKKVMEFGNFAIDDI